MKRIFLFLAIIFAAHPALAQDNPAANDAYKAIITHQLQAIAQKTPPPQVSELTAAQWQARQERIQFRRAELRKNKLPRPPPQKSARSA